MRTLVKTLVLAAMPMIALSAQAEMSQDCILKGEVDKRKAAALNQNVYVHFYEATDASSDPGCNLRKGKRLQFKEPKNAMIEHVPDGAEVTYHYTEYDQSEQAEWRLLSVTMR